MAKVKLSFFIVPLVLILIASSFSDAATIQVKTAGQDSVIINTTDISIAASADNTVDIQCADTQYLSEPGQPKIPWKVTTLLLPPDADLSTVSYTVNNIVYEPLDGLFDIEPSPLYGTWDENGNPVLIYPQGRTIVDGRDVDIYNANEYWPSEAAKISKKGELRRWKLAELAVPMVKYNPVTASIAELVDADIDVTFERTEIAVKSLNIQRSRHRNKQIDRVKKLAANFNTAVAEYESLTLSSVESLDEPAPAGIDSTGYVIITTAGIESSSTKLDDFVSHKESLGWDVSVITESDFGGGTGTTAYNNIHNWLEDNYLTYDILYVLLIGTPYTDTGTVPMLMYDDGRGTAPTDFFYSSFTGDVYWEVVVGRIPYYDNIYALDTLLQKAIDYDNATDTLWRNSAYLAMARLDDDTPMYQCGEQIKNDVLDPHGIDSDRIYEQDFSVSPEYTYQQAPTTDMDDVWASVPYGMVFWCTHGNQTSAQYFIDTGEVPGLNDNYPSIVYQGSCQNAWPENSGNLAYTILKNGAITTVAATRNSFYNSGQTNFYAEGSNGTLALRYIGKLCNNGESSGLAWANTRQDGYTYTPNRMRFNLYGDPSILLTFSRQRVAYYEFEGDVNDSSPNGYHGTAAGSPAYTTGQIGQAIDLDGADDFITLPSGLTSQDITVAAWVYWDGGYPEQRIFDFGNNTTEYMMLTPHSDDSTLRFAIKDGGSEQILETTQLATGQWVHVGVTLEGDTGTLYVGGSPVDTDSITLNPTAFNPVNNYIGDSQWPDDPLFNGRIDDFRIYNHALSQTDFSDLFAPPAAPTALTATVTGKVNLDWADNTEPDLAVYNVYRSTTSGSGYAMIATGLISSAYVDASISLSSTYYYVVTAVDSAWNESGFSSEVEATVPPALMAYYKMDNNVNDSSPNSYHATAMGSPVYTSGKIGQAIDLDGTEDYVTLPASLVNTTDITISAWVNWDSGDTWQRIFDFGNNTDQYMFLTPKSPSSTLRFAITTAGYGAEQRIETSRLDIGEWVHVAVTLEGDVGTLYVDGEPADTNPSMSLNPSDFNPAINYIGDSQFSDDPLFDGRIDDLRIYNFPLSDNDIATLADGNENHPPVFIDYPIINDAAIEDSPYSGLPLTANVYDLEGDTLTFSKTYGPDWLIVAPDGSLSGTPLDPNTGWNLFAVRADDAGGLFDTTTLAIEVKNIYSGVRGFEDLEGFAAQWLNSGCIDSPACGGADLDGDKDVDFLDLAKLANTWLMQ